MWSSMIFPAARNTKPLHARIRLINHAENDREQHFCFRALQRTNANAFQSRMKGSHHRIGHRSEVTVPPLRDAQDQQLAWAVTLLKKLLDQYKLKRRGVVQTKNGRGTGLCKHCIRCCIADPREFEEWLRKRGHASQFAPCSKPFVSVLSKCQQLETTSHSFRPLSKSNQTNSSRNKPVRLPHPSRNRPRRLITWRLPRQVIMARSRRPRNRMEIPLEWRGVRQLIRKSVGSQIPIGTRQIGQEFRNPSVFHWLSWRSTPSCWRGPVSGKTVLLKRIIEEAALAGIPSIVIDGANDLATIGDRWSEPQDNWVEGDAAKADQFSRDDRCRLLDTGARKWKSAGGWNRCPIWQRRRPTKKN